MALSVSNQPSKEQQQYIHEIFSGIKNFLGVTTDSVNESHDYFKMGIEDDFVAYLNKYADSPMTMISHGIDGQLSEVAKILEAIVCRFFFDNKDLIKRAFRSNEKGNFLHYFIVLKKDSLKNRRNFLAFLREYDKELLSRQFPIHFDFISASKISAIKIVKEISLADEKLSTKSPAQ